MRETGVESDVEIEKIKTVPAYLAGELKIRVNQIEEDEELLEGSMEAFYP